MAGCRRRRKVERSEIRCLPAHPYDDRKVMKPTADSRGETIRDRRFDPAIDPKFTMAILLEIARERSFEKLLEKIAGGAAALPATTRFEIWLIEKGGRCLYLAAAVDNSLEGITTRPPDVVRITL